MAQRSLDSGLLTVFGCRRLATMAFSRDTTPEARRVLIDLLRRMPFERKLEIVNQGYAACRTLMLAGIRWRLPRATELEIEEEYFRLMLGPELAARVLEAKRARRNASTS